MTDETAVLLKKKRTVLRTAVTRVIQQLEKELRKDTPDEGEVEELLEQLNDKFQCLEVTDKDCEPLFKSSEIDKELETIDQYREKIVTWRFRARRHLRKSKQQNADNLNNALIPIVETAKFSENIKIKLPKINIPKFNGEIDQWLSFFNAFEASIHKNSSLNSIDKFTYLKGLLDSEALATVEGFAITADNYEKAIELLKDRFGKKDAIINSHMQKLLNTTTLKRSNDIKGLRHYFNMCQTQIRSLESLGVPTESFGTLLCPLILKCLPPDLIFEYNKTTNGSEYKLESLLEFLNRQITARERTEQTLAGGQSIPQYSTSHPPIRSTPSQGEFNRLKYDSRRKHSDKKLNIHTAANFIATAGSDEVTEPCIFCNSPHPTSKCPSAEEKTLNDRKSILISKGACFRCLRVCRHIARDCKIKLNPCSFCGKMHNEILCFSRDKLKRDNKEKVTSDNTALSNWSRSEEVFLQTLIISIKGKKSDNFIRIILDSGSQKSYISKFVAQKLKLNCVGEETTIHGLFGGTEQAEKHKKYVVTLSDVFNSYSCTVEVMDQKMICKPLSKLRDSALMKEIKEEGIFVSDTAMNESCCLYEREPDEIHMLLGADVIGKLLKREIRHLRGGLVAVNTHLGWTVMGKMEEVEKEKPSNVLLSLHVSGNCIKDLWDLDSLGIKDPCERKTRVELEEAAKEHFLRNVSRDVEGRYVVSLPWIQDHPPLSNCKNLAERRLRNCVRSLERTGNLEKYETVFHSWMDEGIIEEVRRDAVTKSEHYLPHHPVYKDNSTTKIRPVFEGSAKERNSSSINECLEKGPNMVELIPAIINKFRLRKFGIIADIEKAFLQIGLQEDARPFLKFLWWEKGDREKAKMYQHKRVVFGISCSPFLLGATLEHHLKQVTGHLHLTAQRLLESFYVDNCVTSVDNEEELRRFMLESREILSPAKFNLRGWEHTSVSVGQTNTVFEEERKVQVLGLVWKPNKDTLSVNWEETTKLKEAPITKRKILSAVHRIFDPIGFTCPVTLKPKVLLQECWKLGVTWDTELPLLISKKFEKWKSQLKYLNDLEIPRCISNEFCTNCDLSLHLFCDASKTAYASCVFLRTEIDGIITCQLVQARARVAPLKAISIPRLELLACTIGSRLVDTTKCELGLEGVPIFCWSDSVNALYWIKRNENWGTFVNNRVQEIRRLTKQEDWKHIAGLLNPADLPSRGCGADELIKSLWWEGPSWLKTPCEEGPISEACPDFEVINSERKKTVATAINEDLKELKYLSEISSYEKIIRVTARILRFCKNARKKREDRNFEDLNTQEIDAAERAVLKIVQRHSFPNDNPKSIISQMQTLVDSEGIIRIKSKIIMRKDFESLLYPIVLPSRHPIVEKLIMSKHVELSHAGIQTVMSTLREKYWILKSRKTVRRILGECIVCKRFTARPLATLSPPLPEDRVREAQVFEITGVDLCGPLFLRDGSKCWIVLFTCAVFRAVHLELATSLSTDNFILALRRFISRRGRPTTIYSDNGTNLVGTCNELKNIDWEKIKQHFSLKKINWKLNPPSSPWWGGFWERLIGMMKKILRRILGKARLTYEELYTTVCDTESAINSRPLTYLSEDQEDLVALTPAMFLQEIKEHGVPDLDTIDSQRMKKRFAYRQRIRQELRKRFRIEYLGQLKNYAHSKKDDIQEGDIVLIGDTNTKRINWPLARVVKLIPGRDGRVRVVEVSTAGGSFLRPIQRLYSLELKEGENALMQERHSKSGDVRV